MHFEIVLPPAAQLVKEEKNIAILKFENKKDKLDWASMASTAGIKVLDERGIAKLVLSKEIGS